jgi:YidC/Oxa1 family membrane protein insertase
MLRSGFRKVAFRRVYAGTYSPLFVQARNMSSDGSGNSEMNEPTSFPNPVDSLSNVPLGSALPTNAPTLVDPATPVTTEAIEPLSQMNPSTWVMQLIDSVHTTMSIPYWESILLFTLGVRLALVPLTIKSMRDGATMRLAQPHIAAIQQRMQTDPLAQTDLNRQEMYKMEMNEIFTKYQVHPLQTLVAPIVQMPLFLSIFFGIRSMGSCGHFPDFSAGGLYWFTDLASKDATMILPVANSVLFLALVELGGEMGKQNNATMTEQQLSQQAIMKNVMRALAVAMVPLTMEMSAGLFVYWTSNTVLTIGQTLVLSQPGVKKSLNIPSSQQDIDEWQAAEYWKSKDKSASVNTTSSDTDTVVEAEMIPPETPPPMPEHAAGKMSNMQRETLMDENARLVAENQRLLNEFKKMQRKK